MRIIVTGGAGFLGSHLCDKLIERGDQVIAIDNLLTGSPNNIAHLQNSPDFQFIEADANAALPEDLDFDQLYHLASPASPNKNNAQSYMALPFETMQVNSFGTWSLCEEALARGAKFLFASTSETYGDPLEHPQKESYRGNVSTTGPRSVYDESKRFGETITSAFIRHQRLDGKMVRIFNTYGPRMSSDGRVVIEFVRAALQNKRFPVFGDGKQTRSFCYVSDLVDGIITVMDKGEKGEVYNLGNPKEFTILELAEVVKKLTGANSEAEFVENLPEDDPARRCPDITKARGLGWEPKIGLEEGLKKLIVHLQTMKTP
ncbi:NAD-dependent epimerase/dehydratase family protein [Candidatus Daviesbacteria bacterium]|nr:NAD-dependent epimerase/dehydratase family protein [Candidatus Daviesbacteria bacterium]